MKILAQLHHAFDHRVLSLNTFGHPSTEKERTSVAIPYSHQQRLSPLFNNFVFAKRIFEKASPLAWASLLAPAFVWGTLTIDSRAIAQILGPGETLQRGDSGPRVTQLQEELSTRGFLEGPIDGTFGPLTEDSVFRFQSSSGLLSVDGVYGPETDAALFGISSADSTASFAPAYTAPAYTPSFTTAALHQATTFVNSTPGSRTLRFGDQGTDVEELQRLLRNEGYYFGQIDGIFGSETLRAVESFQRAEGLVADGIVGPSTWSALGVTGGGPITPGTPGGYTPLSTILRQGRYVVVVPGTDRTKLLAIERELGGPAYLTRSGRGSFMTPGGYTSYREARSDALRLRGANLDARVEFFN